MRLRALCRFVRERGSICIPDRKLWNLPKNMARMQGGATIPTRIFVLHWSDAAKQSEALHGAMGFLQKGDVLLLASRGGKTKELIPIQEICISKGVHTIVVTENTNSPLARSADIVLEMYVNRETDKYNCQGTTSHTVLNVLFDALQAALIEEIDYQKETFALIHPGGAVGERLNQ